MIEIRTANSVVKEIEAIVTQKNLGYIDAILYFCEKNSVEPDFIGDLIKSSSVIKNKIQFEAEDLNFLPKTARLPI